MTTINKANKGEWSEFYAFAKILSEGKLFAADQNLNVIENKSFNVVNISREETEGDKIIYNPNTEENVSIFSEGVLLKIINKSHLKESVKKIFNEIKNAPKGTFESPSAKSLMEEMLCTKIKAASHRKEDIDILIEDRIASINTDLGFSIKSMLGGLSTLFNASQHTNFAFCTKADDVNDIESINAILTRSKVKDRINALVQAHGELSFVSVDSKSFEENLKFIDSNFPALLAEMLVAFYHRNIKNIPEVIDDLDNSGILHNKLNTTKARAVHNIKEFLVAVALGMTPSHMWEGETLAHGGYIIVKEDGEVVCYHLYNRDEFKDYLYNNTLLDTPSTRRNRFALVYEDANGKKCIKLNLQIRFKN